ncbi:transcriptional regulator domain-containing protein [Burkholderia pyrrocinia]|uniref:transcriptional regulator domain-containing protein n=1 Tax=Burkholderia pyrrocinia TaxID=60550 RepID=UPI00158A500B|nr:DUF6499 domain-containing protein [Burkholderia pyrrocinia]
MTAPTDSAAQQAAFVRRADWNEENNYLPDDMSDASAWAWEFLGRNLEYQGDHQSGEMPSPTCPYGRSTICR